MEKTKICVKSFLNHFYNFFLIILFLVSGSVRDLLSVISWACPYESSVTQPKQGRTGPGRTEK